jgi:fatty acid desaturase
MGKKSKRKSRTIVENKKEQPSEFPDIVEDRFKKILRVMSWVVGICFALIIILPNFDFAFVDGIVKFVFFFGVFNLLMFGVMELFGNSVKRYIGPRTIVDQIFRRFSRESSDSM